MADVAGVRSKRAPVIFAVTETAPWDRPDRRIRRIFFAQTRSRFCARTLAGFAGDWMEVAEVVVIADFDMDLR